MSVIKSFFIAFSIYSKIPVPQFAWKEEDMRYTLCFFPWVGAVIGLCFLLWNRFAGVYGIRPLPGRRSERFCRLQYPADFMRTGLWTPWTRCILTATGSANWRF